jgi:hypothetical protein
MLVWLGSDISKAYGIIAYDYHIKGIAKERKRTSGLKPNIIVWLCPNHVLRE